jgi:hypothetical protein
MCGSSKLVSSRTNCSRLYRQLAQAEASHIQFNSTHRLIIGFISSTLPRTCLRCTESLPNVPAFASVKTKGCDEQVPLKADAKPGLEEVAHKMETVSSSVSKHAMTINAAATENAGESWGSGTFPSASQTLSSETKSAEREGLQRTEAQAHKPKATRTLESASLGRSDEQCWHL